MTLYFIALFLLALIHAYYRLPFWLLSIFWFLTPFIFYKLKFITNTQGIITLFLLLNVMIIGNLPQLRRLLFTLPLLRIFNHKDRINWQQFEQIDDGWLVTPFEKSIYNGHPDFKFVELPEHPVSEKASRFVAKLLQQKQADMVDFRKSIKPKNYAGLALDAASRNQ